ncbi:hypothetical protein AB1286_04705 [Trinickia sp. NRRL B-1857]|uniref:hypothetical protein n=1 Tax=Trinickia sp. NRRL B-1857 TaxID=3162879 RepID=UPI003D2A96BF
MSYRTLSNLTQIALFDGLTTALMGIPSSFAGWNFGPGSMWAMPPGSPNAVLA